MDYYCVTPDGDRPEEIEASRRWSLPGVHCAACDETWAITGVAYPSADLSGLQIASRLEQRGVVPFGEYVALEREVRAALGVRVLTPGTGLGPLVGGVRGALWDFAAPNSWTLLVTAEAAKALRQARLNLPKTQPAELRPLESGRLVEFEMPLGPSIELTMIGPTCEVCGRIKSRLPQSPRLLADTLSAEMDLFRVSNFPTFIVATQRFVEAVEALNLHGLAIEPIGVTGT